MIAGRKHCDWVYRGGGVVQVLSEGERDPLQSEKLMQ